MSDTDGLGVYGDTGGTAPVNTVPAARRAAAPNGGPMSRAGTGLEWVPRTSPRGVLGMLGQDDALGLAGAIFRMVLNGAAGAAAGVAMAPSHDKRTKYGVTGGLLGFFLGPLGIGGQALYVISKE